MEITEVRIKLMDDPNDRLQAFCSVTFDSAFVIRDLKIIQGTKGPFVAMPSRKLTDRCGKCRGKNDLRARHCNQCGARLNEDRAPKDVAGRARLYADIAHPINSQCREMIQNRVVEEFAKEQVLAGQPNYVCRYDDFGEESIAVVNEPQEVVTESAPSETIPFTPSEREPEPQTIVFPGANNTTHRIDPAAKSDSVTNKPHHDDAPTHASVYTEEDESFGVGL
ncbi:UNVERIFIED_CONTAM: hypothetical protein GTU68_039945 [Idotea baltica]|nr:hypothetical protein [Idotea baltica]